MSTLTLDTMPALVEQIKSMPLFAGRSICFAIHHHSGSRWCLSVCTEGEEGHNPLDAALFIGDEGNAKFAQDSLNHLLKLTPHDVARIICSTMSGSRSTTKKLKKEDQS